MKQPLRTVCLSLALIGLCVFESGCPMPWDKPAPPKEAKTDDANAGAEDKTPPPLDMTKLLPEAMRKMPFVEVTIPMQDGLQLYGKLYDPNQKYHAPDEDAPDAPTGEDYKGPKYPLVILMHGLDRSNTDWQDLPAKLVKAGYAVFAMDLRGHGKSTKTSHNRPVSWRLLKPEQWQLLPKDANQAADFFRKGEDYPQVDGKSVTLVGAGVGANAAAFAAKGDAPHTLGLVLLSPGMNIKGLDGSQGLIDMATDTLIIVSNDQKDDYNTAQHLYNWITGHKTMQEYQKAGTGTDMLVAKPGIGDQIVAWIAQTMPSSAAPVIPPKPAVDPKAIKPVAKTEKPVKVSAHGKLRKHASSHSPPAKSADDSGSPPVPGQ